MKDTCNFAVWSMQRTGGTSFTGLLHAAHSGKTVQEPFNGHRKFIYVRDEFYRVAKAGEEAKIDEAELLNYNFKICYEYTTAEFNESVFHYLNKNKYFQVLLVRRSERKRLESLALAKLTGAFGVKKAFAIYPKIRSREISLPKIILRDEMIHAIRCQKRTRHMLELFKQYGFSIIYFDDFFAGSYEEKASRLQSFLDLMRQNGCSVAEDKRFEKAKKDYLLKRDQKSRDIVEFIPNLDEYRKWLLERGVLSEDGQMILNKGVE